MTCEKCEEVLIEAAASCAAVNREVAGHVEGCAWCRATLERERELFAAIDDGLRARVNEMPRPGFLAAVHARIAEQEETKRPWRPIWTWAGAAVAAALVLIVIAHPWTGLRRQRVEANLHRSVGPEQEQPNVAQNRPKTGESPDIRVRGRGHFAKPPVIQRASDREPEVLVPPDEAIAFAQFVARVEGRDERAEAIVTPMRDQIGGPKELLELPLVDIADLQSEPLVWDQN